MSKKPKIYANCKAGCLWETVHKSDFEAAATWITQYADESGVYELPPEKNYKIVSPVASNAYSCVVSLAYTDGTTAKTNTFTIAEYDKYRNFFYFEILSLTATASLITIVYECDGNRYSETISGTAIDITNAKLKITGATAVYSFNSDASITGVQGEKGDKGDKGDTGDTGAKIVSTTLQGQDANGGNIYKQTFDNGETATFTAPKGAKGDKGDTGATGGTGATGAKIVSTTLQGQDTNGGNIYKQTFDNGTTATFTAPKGDTGAKGDKGDKGNDGTSVTKSGFFPVGYIFISTSSTSPAGTFGGTWERIKDKFLLAAGDTYSAGATGGSADAVVVSHTHTTETIGTGSGGVQADGSVIQRGYSGTYQKTPSTNYVVISTAGVSGTGKNMPPYIAVYVWKRVS